MTTTPTKLEDQQAITAALYHYAELLDTGRASLIPDEVFTEDLVEDHGAGLEPTRGAEDFATWLVAALEPIEALMHVLSNITVQVDGDAATSRTYYQAFHWLVDGTRDGVVDWMSVGMYLDEWRRTSNGWRIHHRRRRDVGPGSDVIGRRPPHLRSEA